MSRQENSGPVAQYDPVKVGTISSRLSHLHFEKFLGRAMLEEQEGSRKHHQSKLLSSFSGNFENWCRHLEEVQNATPEVRISRLATVLT